MPNFRYRTWTKAILFEKSHQKQILLLLIPFLIQIYILFNKNSKKFLFIWFTYETMPNRTKFFIHVFFNIFSSILVFINFKFLFNELIILLQIQTSKFNVGALFPSIPETTKSWASVNISWVISCFYWYIIENHKRINLLHE